jgi:hypothetical protein
MNFSEALVLLREGFKLTRRGWNGPGQFVYLVPAASYPAQTQAARDHFGEMVPYDAYFARVGTTNSVSTWVPSVGDLLATDWQAV